MGIDPKNDYAFKCVFGNERHKGVLIHLLNAVLQPPPEKRVDAVEIMNPIIEPIVLDDKLSILDIKVRERDGRHFNVEMQMVPHPCVRSRFLYYWSKVYSGQLKKGDDYDLLRPVISICFVDGLLFPTLDDYRLLFHLYDQHRHVTFTDDIEVHLFQLPNFTKTIDIVDPLEKWLYFLNNGERLQAEHLPDFLQGDEYQEATRVLEMLTKDDLERERYEAREKARRDALSWEKSLERAQAAVNSARQEADEARQKADEARQESHEARQKAHEAWRAHLIDQIHFCEQVLRSPATDITQLQTLSNEKLEELVNGLRREVLGKHDAC